MNSQFSVRKYNTKNVMRKIITYIFKVRRINKNTAGKLWALAVTCDSVAGDNHATRLFKVLLLFRASYQRLANSYILQRKSKRLNCTSDLYVGHQKKWKLESMQQKIAPRLSSYALKYSNSTTSPAPEGSYSSLLRLS